MPRAPLLDLNCDLGEGESPSRTRSLMRWITSANVACGGHAGDVDSMLRCVRFAREFGVRLGAHPGPWSRGDMGRNAIAISPAELRLLLVQQIGALEKIAAGEGVRLHHIKLHGALYHAVEKDPRLAAAYLETVARFWPRAKVYALAGGRVKRLADKRGVSSLAEGFADRAYGADGRLVPRGEPGAVLEDAGEVIARVRGLIAGEGLLTADGRRVRLLVDTLCVHSDSPNAVRLVRQLAGLLKNR